MPSSVTHNYFSCDVYNKLNKRIKDRISPYLGAFKIFAQGPDPFFFYDFHLTNKSKKVSQISDAMQHSFTNKHFLSLINYINEKKYYSNAMVMAYLYGQICHFVLDSTCHPYIIYCTGMYYPNDKSTYIYNGLHEEMEYYIDCYLIYYRNNILPKKYKAYKELFYNIKFNNELIDLIDNVSFKVYGFKNVGKIYLKSIRDMKKFYHVFNYDRWGIKKFFYTFLDKICGNRFVKKRELSFHVDYDSKIFYLNNEKNTWNHPCIKNESYNYSFFELYDMAIEKACIIINEVDNMLKKGEINADMVNNLFGNLHYGTGKDCDLNLTYKYFKF